MFFMAKSTDSFGIMHWVTIKPMELCWLKRKQRDAPQHKKILDKTAEYLDASNGVTLFVDFVAFFLWFFLTFCGLSTILARNKVRVCVYVEIKLVVPILCIQKMWKVGATKKADWQSEWKKKEIGMHRDTYSAKLFRRRTYESLSLSMAVAAAQYHTRHAATTIHMSNCWRMEKTRLQQRP